jgi:hypothetical protein
MCYGGCVGDVLVEILIWTYVTTLRIPSVMSRILVTGTSCVCPAVDSS